jgi:energy-converting hydrogenase Eha subunit G
VTIPASQISDLTATAAELNILDGVTATTAELNILDGVTSDAAELNILDGVTATTTELNILDGVTATTAELNYVDGVTSDIQTQLDARVLETNGAVTTAATGSNVVRNITLSTSAPSSGSDGDVWLVYEA